MEKEIRKKIFFCPIVLLTTQVLFSLSHSSTSFSSAPHEPPKVKLSYAEMFDVVCSRQTQYRINQSWISELMSRLPELQKTWETSGVILLKTTHGILKKKFKELEFHVSLSLCSFPSMSDPLLINMRYSLISFIHPPLLPEVTESIVFHEILHRYLMGKIPLKSFLIEKYKADDETVLSHIHLFALQKAVYLKVGLDNTLAKVIKKDESLPDKSYTRAWKIVNDIEDYRDFILELQQEDSKL